MKIKKNSVCRWKQTSGSQTSIEVRIVRLFNVSIAGTSAMGPMAHVRVLKDGPRYRAGQEFEVSVRELRSNCLQEPVTFDQADVEVEDITSIVAF